ncbi:O-methyltransferase family protein [Brugia malayi]|uniref:Bm8743 n=1 Tax=Brugia malayi TaxID=6279 RepID=A0A0J9XMU8_BRUMA|nr:O-methyltransferase family protein [Brugia malayi]CDP91935.1 Bm8743 [Brugia malayi]VIO88590.1 O-methyltransferase family protein [Brugia malayi]
MAHSAKDDHTRYRQDVKIAKSYNTNDPVIQYCTNISVKQDLIEEELREKTIRSHKDYIMVGAPEVLQMGKNMIKLIKAKRVLDIGTFTGSSALAWALALPSDGQIISMDISHESLDIIGKEIFEKIPDIARKIDFRLGSALETLDVLIASGQSGKWDFAFIDADKENYPNYYERCVQLLRTGGVILIDNALWSGAVTQEDKDYATQCIDKTNQLASKDSRVDNLLLTLGDGTHLIFKL